MHTPFLALWTLWLSLTASAQELVPPTVIEPLTPTYPAAARELNVAG